MCGFAGSIDLSVQINHDELHEIALRMIAPLNHRGPDDSGTWVDAEVGVALGHRRLSIVDLSPQGHQPMHSACSRYVIVFNGEIYNFQQIRKEIEDGGAAPVWRGHSDTEVMLAAISQWGLEAAVKRFVGMFAFALWDRKECVLHLVRDRIGEKPIYYGWMGNVFLFGSELKALRAHPAWRGQINRNALALLMRYNYIPTPYSIYKDIFKQMPGTITSVQGGKPSNPSTIIPKYYWSAREVAERGVANPFSGTEAEAIDAFESLLRNSVRQQMVADVPVGAFLSGGVDSSTVVALMQAQSTRPVKTYTIGFDEAAYNEAEHAKAVAQHLGSDHTELYVTPEQAMAVITKLPMLYDEPFSDASQIPTFLICQLVRQHVTVSLSGDGGDELFAGYNHYFWGRSVWNKIGWIPQGLRGIMASALHLISPQRWDWGFATIGPLLPSQIRQNSPGEKLHKLAEILGIHRPEEMYQGMVSHWRDPEALVIGSREPITMLTDPHQWVNLPDFIQSMMYLDIIIYLPDDILVKVDRASMGVSLESRAPFLDYRIVEFAWRLPLSMKIRNGKSKWLLRQVLYKYVPKELIERPKMGFDVPIGAWLRGPLREWAENLLNEKRLRHEGFFNPEPIRQKWNEYLSGKRNWQYYLWDVLMFQAWLENQ